METMELCVTACEKFSNNNEVLPSVQVALVPLTVCDRLLHSPVGTKLEPWLEVVTVLEGQ